MEYNYPKSITQSPPRSQNKMSAVHSEALIIWVMLFKTKTITGDMFVEFVSDVSFFCWKLDMSIVFKLTIELRMTICRLIQPSF